jgi:hypothetical protein
VTEEGDVNLTKTRSAKTQVCITVKVSCECTSENVNTMKSKNVTNSGSAEMLTKI